MRRLILRSVHRLTGLSVGLPLLLFVVTGVPLQFTGDLTLGSAGVPFVWVHKAYGVKVPETVRVADGLVQIDDLLLRGERALFVRGELLGATELDAFSWLATTREIVLWPLDAEAPVERITPAAVSDAFAVDDNYRMWTRSGSAVYISDDLGASWRASGPPDAWLAVQNRPISEDEARRYGGALVSWERWLQDLHSGRFFGAFGVIVMYVASAALVLLIFTGLLVWFGRLRP